MKVRARLVCVPVRKRSTLRGEDSVPEASVRAPEASVRAPEAGRSEPEAFKLFYVVFYHY